MKKLIHFSLIMMMTTQMALAVLPSVELQSQNLANSPTDNHQIQSKITASLVTTNPQGQEVLTPMTAQTQLQSGQIIEYHGYLINQGNERIRSMKVTLDIPQGTQLLNIQQVFPEHPMGTGNGKSFQYLPLKAKIGGMIQDLPLAYYKALRWEIKDLGLNEVATVKYRVQVK